MMVEFQEWAREQLMKIESEKTVELETKYYDNGRIVSTVNGVVVSDSESPYWNGLSPVVKLNIKRPPWKEDES
jgi:hypothetical protein